MNQEPGTDEQINTFCTSKFGVTFPMFSKISVKGDDIHLYQYLTQKSENKSRVHRIGRIGHHVP